MHFYNTIYKWIIPTYFFFYRFPFYYEVKILFLIWLISPVSKGSLGSSILYRRFVHPTLINREEEIDQFILKLQEQGYNTVTKLAIQAFNYVSNVVMQTAIRVSHPNDKYVLTFKTVLWKFLTLKEVIIILT